MTPWQRRARAGVAVIGLATAATVYFVLGERRTPVKADGTQLEPDVVMEIPGGSLDLLEGSIKTLGGRFGHMKLLSDGTSVWTDVTIEPQARDGHDFVITAQEARTRKDSNDLELRGTVTVRERDGFELTTGEAVYAEATGIVRADRAVSFTKGAMRGSGWGMTYDQKHDVLTIADRAEVSVAAEGEQPATAFTATRAILDRAGDRLTLDRRVRVVRGEQVTETDRATVHLTENEEHVQFVELRGQAHVAGGLGSLDRVQAQDIDLDYSDDGQAIEHVALRGAGRIAMKAESCPAGREVSGQSLDIRLRRDQSLETLTGGGGVLMMLPACNGAAARTIESRTLDAEGQVDGSLRRVAFSDQVVFTEAKSDDGRRRATAGVLKVDLKDGALTRALFSGSPTFTDNDLQARSAEADYQPTGGRLLLRGRDARGEPDMSDDTVTVVGPEIDIALDTRQVEARGRGDRVKTSIRAQAPAKGRAAAGGRLPGMLQQDEPVTIAADSLSYDGEAGTAAYRGRVVMSQGATELRAGTLDLLRKAGDLTARGKATSTFLFDGKASQGEAEEIRYVDRDRTLTYTRGTAADAAPARLQGPQGDLRGRQIRVYLAAEESRVERLEAEGNVDARIDKRVVRGSTLQYGAKDETYVVTGTARVPVVVEEACRETRGQTLTYNRSTDTMSIDGRGLVLTDTRNPCR